MYRVNGLVKVQHAGTENGIREHDYTRGNADQ